MDSKSGKMTVATLALILLITGFNSTAMSSGTQIEAEVAAFYTADLPSHMTEELESIQARRTQVNADIEGRLQEWNSYAMRYKKARISSAYRELSEAEKAECDNLRQSLEDEGARSHHLAMQDKKIWPL